MASFQVKHNTRRNCAKSHPFFSGRKFLFLFHSGSAFRDIFQKRWWRIQCRNPQLNDLKISSFYPRQPKYSYLVSRTRPEYFGRRDDYLSYLSPPQAQPATVLGSTYQGLDQAPGGHHVPQVPDHRLGGGGYNVAKSKSYSNFDMMRSQVARQI